MLFFSHIGGTAGDEGLLIFLDMTLDSRGAGEPGLK